MSWLMRKHYMDKCKYDELVYMHMHVHTHYVCHTPSNYNIVTNRQAELTVKPDHWQRYRNIVTDFHTISRYKKKPEIQALHSRVQLIHWCPVHALHTNPKNVKFMYCKFALHSLTTWQHKFSVHFLLWHWKQLLGSLSLICLWACHSIWSNWYFKLTPMCSLTVQFTWRMTEMCKFQVRVCLLFYLSIYLSI